MAELHAQVSDRTVEITSNLYPLKMAVVPRDCKGLGDEWESAGIYVLLGERDGSTWRVYVGQAKELRKRIRQHRKSAEDGTFFAWNRALLVCNTGSFGLSEIGWLEWRMHRLLEAGGVDLENKQIPGEVPLGAASSQADLEVFVGVIKDALVLLGYDPEGRSAAAPARMAELELEDAQPATTGRPHRKLLDVVDAGTEIESTSSKYPATATVEATGIRYQGEIFGSPSAAAKAVTGHDTADGWSFWGVRSDSGEAVSLKRLRAQPSNRTSGAQDVRNARSDRRRRQDRRPVAQRNPRSKTTPKKMSPATVRRLLARKDEGATYVQLGKEFGLTQGSVYSLLLESGRVTQR